LLVIVHSGITADWLLSRIARQLGVEEPAPEKLKLLNQLYSRLVELHEAGKKAVVLIDEAQMLQSKEIMEEFRGLLNLELPESKLITFVLFGLTELEEHLHLDEPLAQRVALKCKLESFNIESTEGYVIHRLRLAGAKTALFTPESHRLIHHFSRGIPRLINTICDNSLFEGYLLKKKTIEPDLVQSVSTDLGLVPVSKTVAVRKPAARPGEVIHREEHFSGPPPAKRPQPSAPPPHFTPPPPGPPVTRAAEDDELDLPVIEAQPEPASAPAANAEGDAMLDNLAQEAPQPREQPKEKDELDDLLDSWEKK
jgi:hypothetical protein